MEFPVSIPLGSWNLHPHPVLEFFAYFIGFRIYLWTRNKGRLSPFQSVAVITAAALGAAAGSKILYWFEDPSRTLRHLTDFVYLMEGKTIVGGLLGGLAAVEWTKRRIGVTGSTGDDMVFPLVIAIAIGRIGCFLSGLPDHTYGTPTSLPWGVDFGDGIPRHPTQLYEIGFLLLFACALRVWNVRLGRLKLPPLPDGAKFQMFMAAYLLFRFAVDFIKPTPHPYFGLNNIQLACLAGLVYYSFLILLWWSSGISRKELVYDREG